MRDEKFCHCGSCGHEKVDECYVKQCLCCLSDHQGAFGKNKWLKQKVWSKRFKKHQKCLKNSIKKFQKLTLWEI